MNGISTSARHLLSRRFQRVASDAESPKLPATIHPLLAAVWMGFVVGSIEVGMVGFKIYKNHMASIAGLRLNRHYPWMMPLANVLMFASLGLLLTIVAKVRKKSAPRFEASAVLFLAILGVLLTVKGLFAVAAIALAVGIASQIGPIFGSRPHLLRPLIRVSVPIFVIAWLGAFGVRVVQLRAEESRAFTVAPAPKDRPNVLLLVLDTVRAKSLSLHGNARKTTPNLDRLAAQGVWFEHARSTAPWTLPSHASMFTGRWPHELFTHAEQPLGPQYPTLAEYLSGKGYATAGFVANTYYCSTGYGLSRGFGHYEDFFEDFEVGPEEILRNCELGRRFLDVAGLMTADDTGKHADMVADDAMAWIKHHRDRPFFAFLNFFDAHVPYVLPPGEPQKFHTVSPDSRQTKVLQDWQKMGNYQHPTDEVELGHRCYEDCLTYLDDALGRFLDKLKADGLLDNTLLVVTSDHGENHGEHSLFCHGQGLYRSETHVPLIVSFPGKVPANGKLTPPASLRDLPATIVDLIGQRTGSPFPSLSLARHWTGQTKPADTPTATDGMVLTELFRDLSTSYRPDVAPVAKGTMYSLIHDGKVYIRNGDATEELYDLISDPEDAHNLAANPESAPILKAFREQFQKAVP